MHVFIGGHVIAAFDVATDGSVSNVRVVESSYQPTSSRYANKSFDGFLEINTISTVSSWQYEGIDVSCSHKERFDYVLQE